MTDSITTTRWGRRRWLHLTLGVIVSAGAIYLALRKTSLHEVWEVLADVDWRLIPLMFALKIAAVIVKDFRWRVELAAMAAGPYHRTFHAIGLGYFFNVMLPFKLGELIRVAVLKRHNARLKAGDALASIAAERVLDGAVIALMVMPVLPALSVEPWIVHSTLLLLLLTLAAVLVALAKPVHRWAQRLLPTTGVFRILGTIVAALSSGSAVMRSPKALAAASGLTCLSWAFEAGVYYGGALALGLNLSFAACLVITFLLTAGLMIPSAPGQLGTHQALSALIMVPFGITSGAAISVSVLTQIVALSTLGGIGVVLLLSEASIKDLLRPPESA